MDLMVGEMKIFEMNGGREGQPFRTECSDHDGAKFFRMLSKFCAASLKGYLGSRRVMNAGCNGHGARRERAADAPIGCGDVHQVQNEHGLGRPYQPR